MWVKILPAVAGVLLLALVIGACASLSQTDTQKPEAAFYKGTRMCLYKCRGEGDWGGNMVENRIGMLLLTRSLF